MAGLDLAKQVGPLPMGAWIAVVAGGLGLAYYTSRTKVPDDGADDTTDESGGTGTGPGLTYVPIDTGDTENETGPATNEEWARIAIDGLTARGYPAALVNSAITKALMGGTDYQGAKMSVQEWSIWQLALMYYGTPPQPVNVPPPTDVPGPVTPPTNPPPTNPPPSTEPGTGVPAHYSYIVKPGDTLTSIAAKTNKQYKLQNSWQTIWNFNLKYRSASTRAVLKARGPNKLFSGSTFWIPK